MPLVKHEKENVSSTPIYRRSSGNLVRYSIIFIAAVVLAIVIAAVTKGSSNNQPSISGWQATSPIIASEVTHVPPPVFDSMGIVKSAVKVTTPASLKGQPLLTTVVNGKKLPEVFYAGGDYCPFCAAQRWSTILALSRFGTFSGLGNTTSGSKDIYPNTQTFTFSRVKYSSPYVAFVPVEMYTNTPKSGGGYTTLQKLTPSQKAIFSKYDAASGNSIPFMSFGDRFFIVGASYSPGILANLSRESIAGNLSAPTSPITQAIVIAANYQTAAICDLTKQKPIYVCKSVGVKAADKKMGIA